MPNSSPMKSSRCGAIAIISSDCCLRVSAAGSLRASIMLFKQRCVRRLQAVAKRRIQPHQAFAAVQVFKSESKRQTELFVIVVHQVSSGVARRPGS